LPRCWKHGVTRSTILSRLEGDDRDVVAGLVAAREITRAVERGKEVDSEDIETAIENYRELFEFLIEDRAAP
jgi:hypothetical protein